MVLAQQKQDYVDTTSSWSMVSEKCKFNRRSQNKSYKDKILANKKLDKLREIAHLKKFFVQKHKLAFAHKQKRKVEKETKLIRVHYAASYNLAKPEKYESNKVCLSEPSLTWICRWRN